MLNKDFRIEIDHDPITFELLSAIETEIAALEESGLTSIGDLWYHDMGLETDGKFNYVLTGKRVDDGNEILYVTAYDPETDTVLEQPNNGEY